MEISGVTVRSFGDSFGNLKAIVSVTFDKQFVVHDVKLIQSRDRMLLQMPATKIEIVDSETDKRIGVKGVRVQKSKGRDVIFRDIVHPISEEFRKKLEKVVVLAYELAKQDSAAKAGEEYSRPTRMVDPKSVEAFSTELEGVTVSYNVPRCKTNTESAEI